MHNAMLDIVVYDALAVPSDSLLCCWKYLWPA